MAISKRRRFEVFKRDQFTCQYCGRRPPEVVLEVDHIVPRCEGGTDNIPNLTTSCKPCNQGKSGVPLGAVAPALSEMEQLEALQEMAERRAALEQQIVHEREVRRIEERAVDAIADLWQTAFGTLDSFQRPSVLRFLKYLDFEDVAEAVRATERLYARKPWYIDEDGSGWWRLWKYFCGACWRMIRQQEEMEMDGRGG